MSSNKTKSYWIYQNGLLTLAMVGLILLILAFAISKFFGGNLDALELIVGSLTNIGGLLLIGGTLQWMFDHRMREEMTREIVNRVLGSTHIHDLGISDCYENSRDLGHQKEQVEEWKKAEKLIIGAHYTDKFFSDYIHVFEERCKAGRTTTILISDPKKAGVEYLHKIDTEVPNVEEIINRIIRLLTSPPHGCTTQMHIYLHPVVLRYLFLATEKSIWIVPMLNSKGRSTVPAIEIRHDSPLYKTFFGDIERLIEQSVRHSPQTP